MATIKAARWYTAKDIRVIEVKIPIPNDNKIKMELKFIGICSSDQHEYTHGPQLIRHKPYPLNGRQETTRRHYGRLPVGKLITSVMSLDEIVERGLRH